MSNSTLFMNELKTPSKVILQHTIKSGQKDPVIVQKIMIEILKSGKLTRSEGRPTSNEYNKYLISKIADKYMKDIDYYPDSDKSPQFNWFYVLEYDQYKIKNFNYCQLTGFYKEQIGYMTSERGIVTLVFEIDLNDYKDIFIFFNKKVHDPYLPHENDKLTVAITPADIDLNKYLKAIYVNINVASEFFSGKEIKESLANYMKNGVAVILIIPSTFTVRLKLPLDYDITTAPTFELDNIAENFDKTDFTPAQLEFMKSYMKNKKL